MMNSVTEKWNKSKRTCINLKSEFQLLKLCQSHKISKTVEIKKLRKDINEIKCNDCALKFKTENGLKVHIELVHPNQFCKQDTLKCKYRVISCSDSDVMKKHMEREHKFICHKCNDTFKEERRFKSHSTKESECAQTKI